MRHIVKAFRLIQILALTCSAPLWLRATLSAQQRAVTADGQETAVAIGYTSDFEVKNDPDNGFLVRRKGTQEWLEPSTLDERIAVGLLDSDRKIYVVTKAVKPPKAKYSQDPEYPVSERGHRKEGWALLHIVVDDKGMVRLPTVDASPSPGFAGAAINAVKNWRFEPAKLDSQPVSVLIRVEISFRLHEHF